MLFLQIYKKGVLFFVETMNYSGYIDDTKQIKRPIIDAKDINRKEILRLYLNFAYEDYWDWE